MPKPARREQLLDTARKVIAEEGTEALATGSATLADIAGIFASAYVDCVLDIGPAMGAAFDALAASEETAAFRQSMREGYIDEYRKGFGRLVDVPPAEGDAIFAGFLGAAQAVADDAAAGRVDRATAIGALS